MRITLARLFERFRPRRTLGERGERYAAAYLRRKGYIVVAGGHRSRYGEIDLIAVWKKQTVVFIEVKTRRSTWAGDPAEAVSDAQKRRITGSALAFLKSRDLLEYPVQFDIVAIVWPKGARQPASMKHYENAFVSTDAGQFYA